MAGPSGKKAIYGWILTSISGKQPAIEFRMQMLSDGAAKPLATSVVNVFGTP